MNMYSIMGMGIHASRASFQFKYIMVARQKKIMLAEFTALNMPEQQSHESPGGQVLISSVSLVTRSPVRNLRKNLCPFDNISEKNFSLKYISKVTFIFALKYGYRPPNIGPSPMAKSIKSILFLSLFMASMPIAPA